MRAIIEAISGIYRITNLLNEHFYIGSSADIARRWRVHKYTAGLSDQPYGSYLYPAMRLYGIENFLFEIIEIVEPVREKLLEREQHYMDILNPTYNIQRVAGSSLGTFHTDEWKAEASVRQTAYLLAHVDENRARREGMTWDELFGVERSAEIRSRMSESRKQSPVVCAGWNKGLPLTDEQRERLITQGFQPGHTPWNKGSPMSEELWNANRERALERIKDPEYLAFLAEIGFKPGMTPWNKDMMMSPEFCQKMADIAKAN